MTISRVGDRTFCVSLLTLLAAALLPAASPAAPPEQSAAGAERRPRLRPELEAQLAAEERSDEGALAHNERVRQEKAAAIAAGQARAEEYGREHPVDGYPDPEVRVIEEWEWDPELEDLQLYWTYRLVYLDGFHNVQYEAYFDQQGNVTTELRESPWRVASQRVEEALGDDGEGTQTAWAFTEDDQGREYPTHVIVQGGGVNRVQMKFNEDGVPYFWDIRDENGERRSFGQGTQTQTPSYGDDGPPLATVEVPRPGTGPCEECRDALEKRNDLVAQMVPIGNRINEIAGAHARVNASAKENEYHVQGNARMRAQHAELTKRYEALEGRFAEADAAWRACEDGCKKEATAAGGAGFRLDLEAGYAHGETRYESRAAIEVGQPAESDDLHVATDGARLAARLYSPCPCGGGPLRPFLEVSGDLFPSADATGARFGTPGVTGLNTVEFEQRGAVGVGLGARYGLGVGRSEVAFLPSLGLQWDFGRFRSTLDETQFIPNALVRQSRRITTTNLVFDGTVQLRPCDRCGFYLFGGGGYKLPLGDHRHAISGLSPGGFPASSRIGVEDGWRVRGGIGWQLDLGSLGF